MKLLNSLRKLTSPVVATDADFWKWFIKNEKRFYRIIKKEGTVPAPIYNKIADKLENFKESVWLLARVDGDGEPELVFTSDGIVKNIVFVEELVKEAPKLSRWKFTALKQPAPYGLYRLTLQNYIFDDTTMRFYATSHPDMPDEIDITIAHNYLTENNREIITIGVFLALDNLLGELRAVTTLDNLTVIHPSEAQEKLIPLHKLKDFLKWREAEFIEKYDGNRFNSESDHYTHFETISDNGKPLLAVMNTDILEWDCKASHPWITSITINYDGAGFNGLPDGDTYTLLQETEDIIKASLCNSKGNLYIGKQTGNYTREVYFASKDFRLPSKALHQLKKEFENKVNIGFDIYKDKYWQTFGSFILCQ